MKKRREEERARLTTETNLATENMTKGKKVKSTGSEKEERGAKGKQEKVPGARGRKKGVKAGKVQDNNRKTGDLRDAIDYDINNIRKTETSEERTERLESESLIPKCWIAAVFPNFPVSRANRLYKKSCDNYFNRIRQVEEAYPLEQNEASPAPSDSSASSHTSIMSRLRPRKSATDNVVIDEWLQDDVDSSDERVATDKEKALLMMMTTTRMETIKSSVYVSVHLYFFFSVPYICIFSCCNSSHTFSLLQVRLWQVTLLIITVLRNS